MQRAGTVIRVAQGMAIARSDGTDHPEIGGTTVSEQLDRVGEIVDVMGPIERPYLVISPDGVDPADLLGETLYVR